MDKAIIDKIMNGDKPAKKTGKSNDFMPDMTNILHGDKPEKPKQKPEAMPSFTDLTGLSMSKKSSMNNYRKYQPTSNLKDIIGIQTSKKKRTGMSNPANNLKDIVKIKPSNGNSKNNKDYYNMFIGHSKKPTQKNKQLTAPNVASIMGVNAPKKSNAIGYNPAKMIGVDSPSTTKSKPTKKPDNTGQNPAQIMGVGNMTNILGDKKTPQQKQFLQKTVHGSGKSYKRFSDFDNDGVVNALDCQPMNPYRHNWLSKAGQFIQGKGYREPEEVKKEEMEKQATKEVTGEEQSYKDAALDRSIKKSEYEKEKLHYGEKEQGLQEAKRKYEEKEAAEQAKVDRKYEKKFTQAGAQGIDYEQQYQQAQNEVNELRQNIQRKIRARDKQGAEPDPEQMQQLRQDLENALKQRDKIQERWQKAEEIKDEAWAESEMVRKPYQEKKAQIDKPLSEVQEKRQSAEQKETAAKKVLDELTQRQETAQKTAEEMKQEREQKKPISQRAASKIGDMLTERGSYRYEYVRDPQTGDIVYENGKPKTKKVGSVSRGISRKLGYTFEDPEERQELKSDDLRMDYEKARRELPNQYYQDIAKKFRSDKDYDKDDFRKAIVEKYKEYRRKDKPLMEEQMKAQQQYAKVQQAQSMENIDLIRQRQKERQSMKRQELVGFLSPNKFQSPQQQMQRQQMIEQPQSVVPDVTGEREKRQYQAMTGQRPNYFRQQMQGGANGAAGAVPSTFVNSYNQPKEMQLQSPQDYMITSAKPQPAIGENQNQQRPQNPQEVRRIGPRGLNEPLLNISQKPFDPNAPKFVYKKKYGNLTRKTQRTTADDTLMPGMESKPSFRKAEGQQYPWTRPLTGYQRIHVGYGRHVGKGAPKKGTAHKKLPTYGQINKPPRRKFTKFVSTYGPEHTK